MVLLTFASKEDAIKFVRDDSLANHKPFAVHRSSKSRFSVRCKNEICKFKMNFFLRPTGEFKLTSATEHNCICSSASTSCDHISQFLEPLSTAFPELTPNQAKCHLQMELKHQISYSMAYRSIRNIKKGKDHENDKSFEKILPFMDWHVENNPNTVARVLVEQGRFLFSFFCPSICVNAFKYSLPLIFLDACHSKSSYKGVLFLASTISQNNEIVPLALGIAPVENECFWSHFIFDLEKALELSSKTNLVVFSDRDKGILNSVNSILPLAHHSFCVVHLERNIKSKFRTDFGKILWPMAKAHSTSEFSFLMEKLQKMSPDAYDYISKISPQCFSLPFFPAPRFGHVTSNVAESLNAWMRKIRYLPPLAALSAFCEFVQNLFVKKNIC